MDPPIIAIINMKQGNYPQTFLSLEAACKGHLRKWMYICETQPKETTIIEEVRVAQKEGIEHIFLCIYPSK